MKNQTIENACPAVPQAEDFSFLPQDLAKRLADNGIVRPTEIQSRAIPLALTGRDVLAQSETGSGKTLAFVLPLGVQLTQKPGQGVRALVLTPTRELATQVAAVLEQNLTPLRLRTLAITGGASYLRQKRALSSGVDVVVGTPGRICDLVAQGSLDLSNVNQFVLDEVDEMLDIGFAEDLKKIRAAITSPAQTLFFSATLSPEIRSLAHGILRDPVEIRMGENKSRVPATIEHGYIEVQAGSELKALVNTLLFHNPERALIFCKTRQECAELAEALAARGFSAAPLHGDLSQQDRTLTLGRFRERRLKYLVSTNVAARGIDVQDLTLVVNYGVPFDIESYTHRVGRTGRNGAAGKAWTIVTPRTCRGYEFLMRKMRIQPVQVEVPNSGDVLNRTLTMQFEELLKERPEPSNRTVSKAVTRALEKLDEAARLTVLRELLMRNMEKMETFYADSIICQRKLVRLDEGPRPAFRDRSERGEGFHPRRPTSGKEFSLRKEHSTKDFAGRKERGFKFKKDAPSKRGAPPWRKAAKEHHPFESKEKNPGKGGFSAL